MPNDNSLKTSGELYFIGERDPVTEEFSPWFKIGLVKYGVVDEVNPEVEGRTSEVRLKEHQTGNPRDLFVRHKLTTPAVSFLENKIHRLYARVRVRGEWFRLSDELLETIIAHAERLASQLRELEEVIVHADDFAASPSTDEIAQPTDDILTWHERWLCATVELTEISHIRKKIAAALSAAEAKGEDVSRAATIKQETRTSFDKKRLEEEFPAIYQEFIEFAPKLRGNFMVVRTGVKDRTLAEINPALEATLGRIAEALIDVEAGRKPAEGLSEYQLELEPIQANAEWMKEIAECVIKFSNGAGKEIEGVCKWNRRIEQVPVFNQAAFEASYPDLKAQLMKVTTFERVVPENKNRQLGAEADSAEVNP